MSAFLGGGPLRTAIKDGVRGARFLALELRDTMVKAGSAASGGWKPANLVLGSIVDASDAARSRLEKLALDFVSNDPQAHFKPALVQPLDRYFATADDRSRDRFARDLYFAAKRVLVRKGAGNPAVSEQSLSRAYYPASQAEAMRPLPRAGDIQSVCKAAAALAEELLKAPLVTSPAFIDDWPSDVTLSATNYVALVISLALAVATLHTDAASGEEDILDAAMAAVDVRYTVMENALAGPEAAVRLAKIFEDLAPHLP